MSQAGVSRHGVMFGNIACRINYISELVSEIYIRTLNPQRKAVVFLPPPLTTDRGCITDSKAPTTMIYEASAGSVRPIELLERTNTEGF
jgi:hypothetical protein